MQLKHCCMLISFDCTAIQLCRPFLLEPKRLFLVNGIAELEGDGTRNLVAFAGKPCAQRYGKMARLSAGFDPEVIQNMDEVMFVRSTMRTNGDVKKRPPLFWSRESVWSF